MLARLLTQAALIAFPRAFRDRLGRPLAQTVLADCRTASGRIAPLRLAAGAAEIVRAGLAERVAVRRRRTRTRRAWSDVLWQDLRYTARRLNRSRGFALVALVTLALGIGANTAIFQLLDAVRLRPLPVYQPRDLVEIRIRNFASARGNFSIWHAGATNAIWEHIRVRQDTFSGVFAWSGGGIGFGDGPNRRWIPMMLVSGGYFPVLGLQPALGRLLTEADDTRGCTSPGMVLSYDFWQKEFGGDRGVIGRTITMGRVPFEVVGVAPRHFTGLEIGRRFDVAVPLCAEWLPPGSPSRLDAGTEWFLVVMGRLKPGMTLSAASARLAAVSPAVFETSLPPDYPAENAPGYRAFVLEALDASTGISMLREQYAAALWFLQATASLVLLVGCANLANLMLARATSRQRELASRVALGAGRAHLIRVLLAESLCLSLAGAALGAWLAKGVSYSLVTFLDGGANSLFLNLSLDWRLLGFVSLAALITCVLCGFAPAWRGADVSPADVLRAGSRGSTDSHGRVGLRQVLVTSQVALSLLLLTGALLFGRSLNNLVTQNLGFQPDGVTIGYVDMGPMNVPIEWRHAFTRHVLETLEATPGVVAATVTGVVPLSGSASDNEVWLDGIPSPVRAISYFADIGPHYFKTLAIPVVAGRTFDDRDITGAPLVAIVNEAFVQKFVPDARPLGTHVWREARTGTPATRYEIVGLVKNAKYQTLRQELRPTIYLPAAQDPEPGAFAQMLIRTSLPDGSVEATLKNAIRAAGPEIVPTFASFRTLIDRTLTQDQVLAALSGFFGVLAVVLATIGLYGSMSFVVARRTREIGVRIALGASREGILRLVLREAILLVAAGCLIGGTLALTLSRYVGTLLYSLAPNDPVAMIGAVVLLMAVAAAASLVPALRAARVDPAMAFRQD
jgi:putative ABC transport system permease protein